MVIIGLIVSIGSSFTLRGNGIWAFYGWIQYVGIFLMALGIFVRQWAVFTLGKGFTVKVHVQDKGKLITGGPYKILRHPSYTGGILTALGLPLALGTWAGILITLIIMPIIYIFRINTEEKALIEAYGKKYKDYMKKSWKLIPFVY